MLAACADTPKEYNPIEWGRSAVSGIESLFTGDKAESPPIADAPPAEGRPYPNLGSVPRPTRTTPGQRAERQSDVERLAGDREAALADDQALRATGTPPPPRDPTSEPQREPQREPASAAANAPPSSPPTSAQTLPPSRPPSLVQAAPPAAAAPAATAPAVARRVGSLGFARDAAALSPAAERALAEAASLARAGNARIRLVPAQVARQAIAADLARARATAITQALSRAGIAATRLSLDEAQGRRVDLYDIYVEG